MNLSRQAFADTDSDSSRALLFNEDIRDSRLEVYITGNYAAEIHPHVHSQPRRALPSMQSSRTHSGFPLEVIPSSIDNRRTHEFKDIEKRLHTPGSFFPEIKCCMIMTHKLEYQAKRNKLLVFAKNLVQVSWNTFTTTETPSPSGFETPAASTAVAF